MGETNYVFITILSIHVRPFQDNERKSLALEGEVKKKEEAINFNPLKLLFLILAGNTNKAFDKPFSCLAFIDLTAFRRI